MIHSLPEPVFTANIVLRAGSGELIDAITVRWQRDREDVADIVNRIMFVS